MLFFIIEVFFNCKSSFLATIIVMFRIHTKIVFNIFCYCFIFRGFQYGWSRFSRRIFDQLFTNDPTWCRPDAASLTTTNVGKSDSTRTWIISGSTWISWFCKVFLFTCMMIIFISMYIFFVRCLGFQQREISFQFVLLESGH